MKKDNTQPYVTYKAFGGIIGAFCSAIALVVLFGDVPPGGGPPEPLTAAIFPAILGALGLYIFIASDKKIKEIDKQPMVKKKLKDYIKWALIIVGFLIVLYFIVTRLGG